MVISHEDGPVDEALPANNHAHVDFNHGSPPPSPPAASQHHQHSSPDHAQLASRAAEPTSASLPRLPFTLEELFEKKVVLLRHCPKTTRRELASLLNSTWKDVLNNPDNEPFP